ncbi:LemA family protein [Methanobacterium alkalithermotolerans]|uniref:LemA family protein n=1 Tax=Methanobacterium alkalithermotolerans TaxID=2731220 RepID=A0A8T8K796_9EURY|nr:LemA family protein [Methanobacterium alkalithermotolerans]QUH23405.1 LemA family protein [Methanobacterium alkalithermotolerans]
MDISYIILAILILIIVYLTYSYNRLIKTRNMVDTAYSNIDTLLQKRFDLVPNLVSTVKGYMKHERELLETVTRARSDWMNASTIQENAGADNIAKEALKSIFAVAENYPDLKANQNFLLLQEELVGIENKIAYARQRYNRTVLDLNNAIQQFPTNLIAHFFRFQSREFFEVESLKAREVPQVKYDGDE